MRKISTFISGRSFYFLRNIYSSLYDQWLPINKAINFHYVPKDIKNLYYIEYGDLRLNQTYSDCVIIKDQSDNITFKTFNLWKFNEDIKDAPTVLWNRTIVSRKSLPIPIIPLNNNIIKFSAEDYTTDSLSEFLDGIIIKRIVYKRALGEAYRHYFGTFNVKILNDYLDEFLKNNNDISEIEIVDVNPFNGVKLSQASVSKKRYI